MIKKYIVTSGLTLTLLFSGNIIANANANTYTVRSGDSLWLIQQKLDVSIADLKEWNQLTSNTIYPGQTLKISSTSNVNQESNPYTVVAGDTLYKLANSFQTTIQDIKQLNNLHSDIIYVGQKLLIPGKIVETTSYTVKAGDTLYKIAEAYNTTIPLLKQWNGLTTDTIYIGQQLKVTSNSEQTPSQNLANSIISEGKKHLGVPYVWGGSTPSGFDCSGFLNYIFAKNGLSIPRTVETIWNAGNSISTPRIGDLVFFETYKKGPSHAGVYLGNGEFIHAGSSSGVTISNMNNSYWKPRYLGAKKYY